jgi:ketosteroid isomerase-like protein
MSELQDAVDTHYRGLSSGDLDTAVSVFADDVQTSMPGVDLKDLASFREVGAAFLRAAPDMKLHADATYESGDTIVTEGTFSGTHTGPLFTPGGDIPATGRSFELKFADVMTMRGGKVVTHHVYYDNLGFMQQLGLAPQG